MKQIKYISILIIILSQVMLLTGCNPIKTKIEHEICKAVNKSFAPADNWKCSLSGNVTNWIQGRTPKVSLSGKNVRYNNINYSEMQFILTDISYNMKSKKLTECSGAEFNAVLTEKEINTLTQSKFTDIKNPYIKIKNNSLLISGTAEIMHMDIKAEAEGQVLPKHGCELWIIPNRAGIIGMDIKLPSWTKDSVSKKINPVYTLDTSKNGLFITDIKAKPEKLIIKGSINTAILIQNQ